MQWTFAFLDLFGLVFSVAWLIVCYLAWSGSLYLTSVIIALLGLVGLAVAREIEARHSLVRELNDIFANRKNSVSITYGYHHQEQEGDTTVYVYPDQAQKLHLVTSPRRRR